MMRINSDGAPTTLREPFGIWSRFITHRYLSLFPTIRKGMALIAKIRSTFRSVTGQKYGPGFIDQGLAIGEELYRVMKTEFGLY